MSDSDEEVIRPVTYETRRERIGSPIAVLFLPLSVWAHLKTIRKARPDAIIISAYSPFLLIEPLLVSSLLRIPVIYDVLDSWILMSEFHPGRFRNWIRRSIEKLAFSHAKLIVAVTGSQLDLLAHHYHLSPDRLILTPRGTDPIPDDKSPRSESYDIIHIGPPRAYYDNEGTLEFLVRLARFRPKLRVAFLGVDEGPTKIAFEAEIAKKGLEGNVDLLPTVPRLELPLWTRKARAGLISLTRNPLYRAAISTKAYDYVTAGIPILYLGPSDSEQGWFITKYKVGQVGTSPAELAEKAASILTDEATLRNLAANAKTTADALTWTKVLRPLYDRVRALAAGKTDGGERSP